MPETHYIAKVEVKTMMMYQPHLDKWSITGDLLPTGPSTKSELVTQYTMVCGIHFMISENTKHTAPMVMLYPGLFEIVSHGPPPSSEPPYFGEDAYMAQGLHIGCKVCRAYHVRLIALRAVIAWLASGSI